jgi:hypothetical protein
MGEFTQLVCYRENVAFVFCVRMVVLARACRKINLLQQVILATGSGEYDLSSLRILKAVRMLKLIRALKLMGILSKLQVQYPQIECDSMLFWREQLSHPPVHPLPS